MIEQLIGAMPPASVFFGQMLIGLINGSFYAILSLGLAVIFGLLNVVNFAHGAQYMLGALCSYLLLTWFGIGYWPALIISPILVGALGILIERLLLRRVAKLHHMYGMLLTFGLALVIEGVVRQHLGATGNSYPIPQELSGGWKLGFMFLPAYRGWVIAFSVVTCFATWFAIERTRLGTHLRAANENPGLTRAFGINVPRLLTLTYGASVGLAALAGAMAAPIYQVSPQMGSEIIIVVFAVVVIGGMGSIMGSIISGFALGIAEGLTKVFYPQASTTVVFVIMAVVLLLRPGGLLGAESKPDGSDAVASDVHEGSLRSPLSKIALLIAVLVGIGLPFVLYPVFVMKVLCLALLASGFNLLMGYGGLLSFGHAAFFGAASYITAYCIKALGFEPLAGVLTGTLAAALLGAIFGWIAIRRQGIYFAMITLALSQMVYFMAVQLPFTNNDEGIQGVPRGMLLGFLDLNNPLNMYYFVLAVFAAAMFCVYRIVHSPFGSVLKSIRDNEPRATSLGYDTAKFRLMAFILSAALAGVGGSLDALVFQIASLTNVHWSMSGHAVLMSILGGVGTLTGPIIGAIIVAAMENYLADAGSWISIIHGTIFILCVVVFRRGLVGELAALRILPALWKRGDALGRQASPRGSPI
jgi:branched-chain amino acid transport system permease protein